MLIYINGSLIPGSEAKVSVFDRGFLYGDGVFETLRSYNGVIFHCDDHLERLFESADGISLTCPFTKEYLKEALYRTLKENNLKNAYLRLTITRGESEPGLEIVQSIEPTVIIIPKEFNGYPESLYLTGIHAAVVNTRRTPPSSLNPAIKSINFLNNIIARAEAKALGATEGIMLSTEGYVAEGTTSNIFIVKDSIIKTPSLETGILNGVTRSVVINLARENQITVIEEPFYPDELYNADECFITNTTYEIMPVTRLNGRSVGNGRPGEITKKLITLFKANLLLTQSFKTVIVPL
ncbi:MAG: branched-chain-amino-acid transaminase [Nitrospirae bacterium]|nr:branched-chain-amino-acid transaminase [Nitrospirota bacterium]